MTTKTTRGYLSWREAEDYTGLSESGLRRLVREGKIRAFRPSPRRTLLSKDELDRYLQSTELTTNTI